MKLNEIIQNIEVEYSNADPQLEINGISYDSRKTKKTEIL